MDPTTQQPTAVHESQRSKLLGDMSVANNLNTTHTNRAADESNSDARRHSSAIINTNTNTSNTSQPYPSNFSAAASNMSLAAAENSTSSLSTQHHQYHYIQYPAYYYAIEGHAQQRQPLQQQQQKDHSNQANSPFLPVGQQQRLIGLPEVATCHCHCSCGAQQMQQQQQQLLFQRQYQQRLLSASTTDIGQQQQQQQTAHRPADSSQVVVQVHCQSNGETDCEREHERERNTEHDHAPPSKAQSEQSLLNHSYQTLQIQTSSEEKPSNLLHNSKLNISCDCDLECTCGAERLRAAAGESKAAKADLDADVLDTPLPLKPSQKQCQIDAMLGVDEITVSESDNNSTMIKKKKKTAGGCSQSSKKRNSWCHMHDQNSPLASEKNCDCHYNSSHNEIYSDGDSKGGLDSIDDQRPPLPPRPPPPPRLRNATITGNGVHRHGPGIKKYVVWCLICGGISCLLGILFLGVYFLLHSYTITVGNFETVPTFVPATLLILTGICIMSLARRRNRYSYLIKLSGVCGLISALTCALVTVTTTVLHMSRLQALRECEYAQKTRTCTCYSDMIESQVDRVDKEGVRLVFDSLSDCGVVHGSLYSCLRAIFGLSVAGVLVAVFSCMLVYQLLSHERKKMYWEQLELRCRSLYTSQQGPPPNMAALAGGRGGPVCRCCEQCHLHRQVPLQATAYPWDDSGEPRFWTGQPPGNFYSPNPGGDGDLHMTNAGATCRGHSGASGARSRMTGWSWPRMPWQRNSPVPSNARPYRQTPSSPDSQYGFTNNTSATAAANNMMAAAAMDADGAPPHNTNGPPFNVVGGGALPYGVWGPPPPYSDPNSPARRGYYHYIQPNQCGNNLTATTNNINHHSSGNVTNENSLSTPTEQRVCLNHRSVFLDQQPHTNNNNSNNCCSNSSMRRNLAKRRTTGGVSGGGGGGGVGGMADVVGVGSCGMGGMGIGRSDVVDGGSGNEETMKTKSGLGEYENTPSESDGCNMRDRFSNTLPTRKLKKRNDANIKANIGGVSGNPQPAPRLSMQQIIDRTADTGGGNGINETIGVESPRLGENECMEPFSDGICDDDDDDDINMAPARNNVRATLRQKRGIENNGFQTNSECVGPTTKQIASNDNDAGLGGGCETADMHDGGGGGVDPAESEVYFADVSSCCNMSLKNDNYYDEAHHHPATQHHVVGGGGGSHHSHPHPHSHPHHHHPQHQHQNSNCSQNSSSNNEDYLAQRFGQRENSIRSRLPFPQTRNNNNNNSDYEENLDTTHQKDIIGGNVTPVNHHQIQKEISCQSMCSVESEAQTECTDLSPATPCSNKFAQTNFDGKLTTINTGNETTTNATQRNAGGGGIGGGGVGALPNFVAKFPYSSESQSLEAHRRSTKDIQDLILSTEAHYEIINDAPIQQTPPPCQFSAQQPPPNIRVSKPQPQRPTNLSVVNKTKTKHNGKTSRDRIEANMLQSDRDWANASKVASIGGGGGGGGGGNSERKCL